MVNSCERGGSARRVGALCAMGYMGRLQSNERLRERTTRRFKINVMRNRPRARSAAERAELKLCVRCGVMM